MAVSQRLEFRQTQSLVMTPQLQQAIKLLQLSNLELSAYIEQEVERNPLLEQEAHDDNPVDTHLDESESKLARHSGEQDIASLTAGGTLPSDSEAPLDSDYENVFDGDGSGGWNSVAGSGSSGASNFETDEFGLEDRLREQPTLRTHLTEQLQLASGDPATRLIGLHLIDMLDESGYLKGDLGALADLLGCDSHVIEETVKLVQGFDPAGLFARDLRECLALQLADRNRLDPAMQALLDNLELLAGRAHGKLKQLCGVDDEDLTEMIAEIKALDPKPGLSFDPPAVETLVPDVLVRSRPDGGWQVELNSETLPRLLVNRQYYNEVQKRSRRKADKEYLADCLQSANWLVRSLHQRATTILKVASEIVRQQDAFLRKGIAYLRPLTLREIAEAIEMHESTVSRVTAHKYMASPRGIYELKYFFTSAIAGTQGDSVSAESVRHRIRCLIDAENPKAVLSDDTLVELLREDGIDIARRTVAKYREAMRIPSSVQRRREKTARV